MSSALGSVLPVLRTPSAARADGGTFHMEIPGDRVSATPWAAFTMGGPLLTRAQVAAMGVTPAQILEAALANLAARPASWTVEQTSSGFLGFGKQPRVLSFTDPFAAEQILNAKFLGEAQRLILPKDPFSSRIAYFAPRRGQLRAVLSSEKFSGPVTVLHVHEESHAKAAFASAGDGAVCPAQLHWSGTRGNSFAVGARFFGAEEPYLPPVESVGVLVVDVARMTHLKNLKVAPSRPLVGDLALFLGTRDPNGQQTLLTEPILNQLGLPFQASLDTMISRTPVLPVIEMGTLSTGQPLFGFRGSGAIDQLVSPASLQRLHAVLGDPFVVHVYSHFRVAATTTRAPIPPPVLHELVELCDPRPPGVIMTRGTSSYTLFTISGGKPTGVRSVL